MEALPTINTQQDRYCINSIMLLQYIFLLALLLAEGESVEYGVDCSFPIHSTDFKCGDLLGGRKTFYENFMQGCRDYYGPKKANRCDSTEADRLEMSLRQPMSMVNYTSTGFKKIKAPKAVFDLLSSFWQANKNKAKEEQWYVGNVYVNHWESKTYMVSIEDSNLRGGGFKLKEMVWEAARSTIEEWTGMEQKPISMYGIRKYTNGAILSPHVDRLPLVSSCIVNVDQDVDEPWPLEVIDRQGRAVNVTMEPGDMVLYESGSLIHARPFPLKGRFFANIFIHFEPTGRKLGDTSDEYLETLDPFYPPYLLKNSPEVENWKSRNPEGWHKPVPSAPIQQVTSPEGHAAAAYGDVATLAAIAKTNKRNLFFKDANGWQPIHEAARGGHVEALEFLINHGADINARTGENDGSSPLNLVEMYLGATHEAAYFLSSLGAFNLSPETEEL